MNFLCCGINNKTNSIIHPYLVDGNDNNEKEEKEECKCKCCNKIFNIDELHINDNVEKESEFYQLCDICFAQNNMNESSSSADNCDSVWEKGKKFYDDM